MYVLSFDLILAIARVVRMMPRTQPHLLAKGWVQHLGHTSAQGSHNVIAVLSSADNGAYDRNVIIRHLDLPVCGSS